MRKICFVLLILFSIAVPSYGVSFTVPTAPASAQEYMDDNSESFSEGLWHIICQASKTLQPSITEATATCAGAVAVCVLISLLSGIAGETNQAVEMAGAVCIAMMLISSANSMIQLCVHTIQEITQYGRLLLPVMSGALAAQGGATRSGALYIATAFFDTLLSSAISELLTPLVYIHICLSMVCRTFPQELLESVCAFLKWLITWSLKIILYVFTAYISITGVVGGTTDAAMLKATKLTISGVVPVVGGILSDASEAVLVSAGVLKNAAGVYGLLVIIGLWIGPFIRIGIQYLMLKITSGICLMFGTKKAATVVKDFAGTMGVVLGMLGAVCMMQLISTICFMKGVSQ